MEVLREQVAAAIQGALPAIPPQDNGFEVGDILLVNRSQNPARRSRMSDEWFSPLNQNIRDFAIEYTPPPPSTATGVTSIALTKKNSLDAGIKAKLTGLFGLKSLFARSEDESITIELIDKTLTNGRTGLNKDVFFDDSKMDPMFHHPMNKESWISDGCGLVAFVEQSWSGDIQFKDSSGSAVSLGMGAVAPIPASVPLAASANFDFNKGATGRFETSGLAVVGFTVSIFKLAVVEEQLYKRGPIAILNRQPEQEKKLRAAISWCKLGNLYIQDGSPEATELTTGMKKLAHLVAPADPESNSWSEAWQSGVTTARVLFSSLTGSTSESAKQCAFTVKHDTNEEITFGQAREAIRTTRHLIGSHGSDGNVTMEDAEKEMANDSHFHSSKTVILWYNEKTLAKLFHNLKSNGGSLELGGGFLLKEMRPALVFDMYKAGLVPVHLSSRYVYAPETPVPTKVFRVLENGAYLMTPVQGVPASCQAQGLILGNGGCDEWELKTSVKYLDTEDPELLASKKAELQGQNYLSVKRLPTDIDYKHKKGHVKMVRCVVEPVEGAAIAKVATAAEIEHVQQTVQSPGSKHTLLPTDSPQRKKQKGNLKTEST